MFIEERTVDVHIKRLREALGEAAAMVETVARATAASAQAMSTAMPARG